MARIVAVASPVAIGVILGPAALGGTLAGATATGVLMALFMANAGGAWDNAKKAIEQGEIPGAEKGDEAHSAAVVGDTIGDPFKDTSGPSLNILIKLMSIVSVVIAGLIAKQAKFVWTLKRQTHESLSLGMTMRSGAIGLTMLLLVASVAGCAD